MGNFFKKFGSLVLGVAAGFLFGPGAFSLTAFSIGSVVGSLLFNRPSAQQGQLGELQQPKSEYGAFIPICYGGDLDDGTEGGLLLSGQFIDCLPSGAILQQGERRQFSCAILWCEGEKEIHELWANDKIIFNKAGVTSAQQGYLLTYDPITGVGAGPHNETEYLWNYPGNNIQPINPKVSLWHGGDEWAPAYRGMCYSVVFALSLEPYDFGVPNFRAKVKDSITGRIEMIEAWAVRAGLPDDVMQLTHITGEQRAQFMSQQGTARDKIEELANLSFCDVYEVDGVIRDSSRENPTIHAIPAADLGASTPGNDIPPALVIEVGQGADVPSEVSVSFIDADNKFENGLAKALGVPAESQRPKSIELTVVDGLDNMTKWAQPALDEAIAAKDSFSFSLPSAWLNVSSGDVVNVPSAQGTSQIRITEQTAGLTGPIECKGVSYDGDVYSDHRVTTPVVVPAPAVDVYGDPVVVFANANAAFPEMIPAPAFIIAAAAAVGEQWADLEFQLEPTVGPTQPSQLLRSPSVIGEAVTALGDCTDIYHWDEASTVEIETTGTLTATDADGIANRENRALLGSNENGWEEFRFRDVTLLGTVDGVRTYELSGFRRGDSGTEVFCGAHEIGDTFILLDENVLIQPYQIADVDQELDITVTRDYTGEDFAETHTGDGANVKPLAPIDLAGVLDGDDWELAWKPRDRDFSLWWRLGTDPFSELEESYVIDIYDGPDVVGTYTSSTASLTYTDAQQTADFGSLQSSSLTYTVQQIGQLGRGYAATATITA